MSIHGDKQLQTIREYYQRIRDDSQDQVRMLGILRSLEQGLRVFLEEGFPYLRGQTRFLNRSMCEVVGKEQLFLFKLEGLIDEL